MPAHVLRTTRKIYGLSQAKLASMVGISLTAIKQIETGRLQPSPTLSHRIYMQTGLDPWQLMENSFPDTPFHPMGMEISKELFKGIQQGHREFQSQERLDESLRHFNAVLETLLDASIKEGKLWALRPALQNAISKLIVDFDLQEDFARLLFARWGLKDPWANTTNPASDLYTLVNGKLFEKEQKNAQAQRRGFYKLQTLKNGKPNGSTP